LTVLYTTLLSPIGELLVYGDGDHIDGIHFAVSAYAPRIAVDWTEAPAAFAALREQLEEYFEGRRTGFDLPVRHPDAPPLHREVWSAVERIPYGSTSTYATIAAELGRPRAARAVGRANARNPFAIVVPCHRLVGTRSTLRGYAGGLDAKRYLLNHEARKCVASMRP
jgi:methylated-DNA-[protein]-cysteine S-methyltransferase